MSSQDRYEDDVCYDAREPCSSGRAQRRSIHVRACRGPKDWRSDVFAQKCCLGERAVRFISESDFT